VTERDIERERKKERKREREKEPKREREKERKKERERERESMRVSVWGFILITLIFIVNFSSSPYLPHAITVLCNIAAVTHLGGI
jgi:hypothetical protein